MCATDVYDLAHPATAIAYGVTVDTDGDNAGDALPTSKSSFLGHDYWTTYRAAGGRRRRRSIQTAFGSASPT